MDPEKWLADFEQRIEDMRTKSAELEEGIANSSVTVSSPDGSVRVTVAPNGSLQSLDLGHRACDLGPGRLTELIMQSVRKAQAQAAHKVAEVFAPLGGGTEAMQLFNQFLPQPPEDDDPAATDAQHYLPAEPDRSQPAQAPYQQQPHHPQQPYQPQPPYPPVRPPLPPQAPTTGPAPTGRPFPPGQGTPPPARPRPRPQSDDDDDDVELW
ncbi:YbaB/EbfC family nucleoid-associated protein [Goodfellowiella coeruleoviolacea]|uniref:YbaB/EbfC DNA-binding family protein n=1 Tax=Goodfellowiella coeruleoviolacea TaxID=334858 RepID=A0AAE3KDG2_9PSEU|nr:YbaB/EbfC family nucleoid-associated protein [Goodfellowiella coeruleoviolacea]MCP2164031.1 YbaB/EbfC DNA-binding family protein [Goodfellowiella coeruleoviolacea]